MYINTLWHDAYVNSLAFEVLTLYGLGYMLDISHGIIMLGIPQQNPLKYGFSGIEVYTAIMLSVAMQVHYDVAYQLVIRWFTNLSLATKKAY